jgi:hypothetical protein
VSRQGRTLKQMRFARRRLINCPTAAQHEAAALSAASPSSTIWPRVAAVIDFPGFAVVFSTNSIRLLRQAGRNIEGKVRVRSEKCSSCAKNCSMKVSRSEVSAARSVSLAMRSERNRLSRSHEYTVPRHLASRSDAADRVCRYAQVFRPIADRVIGDTSRRRLEPPNREEKSGAE